MDLRNLTAVTLLCAAPLASASAQDITFKFNNPSFGGNSFNSSHLLGLAELQKEHQDPVGGGAAAGGGRGGATDAFIRQLESRLLSSLATNLVNQITDAEPGTSDTVIVGDQQIFYEQGVDALTVTITSLFDGSATTIRLPTSLTSTLQ